jgi:hypothetical protein
MRPLLQAAALVVRLVVRAVLAWTHRSMFYDGAIYLHVVQNILALHGPVFSTGQRVESFTSSLWTALLALVAIATPFSLTGIAVDLGITLTVAGLALAVVSSVQLGSARPSGFARWLSGAARRSGVRRLAGGVVAGPGRT